MAKKKAKAKQKQKKKKKKKKAQKAKNINNANIVKEDIVNPKPNLLDEAKSFFLERNRDSFESAYRKLNTDDLNAMKEFIKENSAFAPVAMSREGLMTDAATTFSSNKKLLRHSKNKKKNILIGIDDDLSKEITKELRASVKTGKSYFNDIRKKLVNNNEIIDYSIYGDIVSEISNKDISIKAKKDLKQALKLEDNIYTKENLTNQDIDEFTKKTFKGDPTSRKELDQYAEDISKYLVSSDYDEDLTKTLKKRVKRSVSREYNLKYIEQIKQKRIKEKKEKKEIKQNKKKARTEKKQQKKALGELRRKTGTEGGTLVDFAKGQRGSMFNVGINALFTIGDYKEGLKEGKTHLGAAADAAVSFVGMELLGVWGSLGLGAAKGVATLGIKGTKYAINSSRSMNNIQRFTPFADAQFQDNQQMATMRQSGMELAKMSQYNLQQTLMGTEARNLHR